MFPLKLVSFEHYIYVATVYNLRDRLNTYYYLYGDKTFFSFKKLPINTRPTGLLRVVYYYYVIPTSKLSAPKVRNTVYWENTHCWATSPTPTPKFGRFVCRAIYFWVWKWCVHYGQKNSLRRFEIILSLSIYEQFTL